MVPGKSPWIWIALVSATVSVACARKQEPLPDTAASPSGAPAAARVPAQLLGLLPEENLLPGWSRDRAARYFGPDTLWEYIDGAAESYLSYGFEQVVTAEYKNLQQASQATIDIYRMKDAKNAFGIYTAELNPDAEFRKIGVEGYVGGTGLNFWCGSYYVKITVSQEGPDLVREMIRIAEFVNSKLGAPGSEPVEVGYFPRENLVPHSIRYTASNVLGQSYLRSGFEARYRHGGSESRIVIATLGDERAAREALAKYRQFIASSGKVGQELKAPGDGGFSGTDNFYGHMAVLRKGNRLILALGGPSADFVLLRIQEITKRLSGVQ